MSADKITALPMAALASAPDGEYVVGSFLGAQERHVAPSSTGKQFEPFDVYEVRVLVEDRIRVITYSTKEDFQEFVDSAAAGRGERVALRVWVKPRTKGETVDYRGLKAHQA